MQGIGHWARRFRTRSLWAGGGLLLAALISALGLAAGARAGGGTTRIEVLSTRADLVSGGRALTAIDLPAGTNASQVHVLLGQRNITSEFARRANGRYEGLVTGLGLGANVLSATLPGGSGARLTITNHPIGGPVFSGPQLQPWVCQTGATDSQCDAPTTYQYQYKSSVTGQFSSYDPKNPPPDVATTTTDQGVTVPYIIREETGYLDRDQYAVAVLFQPGKSWAPWAPQKQWDHKLLITHGASCGIDHTPGSAPSVVNDAALSRGFAVMSTAMDNAGHDCSVVTEAESLIMAKEHLIDNYGEIRYTIGTGCSGGSLAQQQVANAYPGLYQGILPQCSFPDSWTTSAQVEDYDLTRQYLENPSKWGLGVVWTPTQIDAIDGHFDHANSIEMSTLYAPLGNPTASCAGVTAAEQYNPQTNPNGARCTLQDYMINLFGRRPPSVWSPVEKKIGHGFAGSAYDNVGVQYGLNALMSGTISPAQFADLNSKVGSRDIDYNLQAPRVAANDLALQMGYQGGAFDEANNLNQVAIIDLRGPDYGSFHDVYRSFTTRARLDRDFGSHANQIIWEGTVPLMGDVNYTTTAFVAMDRWLTAVEADHRNLSQAQKVVADKPKDITDQCSDGVGQVIPDPAGQDACQALVQAFETPRMVAGEPITTDTMKCQLKPLVRSNYYPQVFTDAQWAQVQAAFPSGVCDYTKPGVEQQPTVPWMTYQGGPGTGHALGPPPQSQAF